MILKIGALLAILVVIYLIFFKTTRNTGEAQTQQTKRPTKKNDGETMIECAQCSTFISNKEAIIKDGKFFCSRECAKV